MATYRNLDVNATGALIYGAPGRIMGGTIHNRNTAERFLKLYDKATAPTVGTDTPRYTFPIPGLSVLHVPDFLGHGRFKLGIGIGATTAIADNSTAAPSTNDVVVNFEFQ